VDVQITPAVADEHSAIEALSQLYGYDFSELLGLEVGDDGRFRVPPIGDREPYLFRVDGKLAGFALLAHVSRLTGEAGVHDVAEFFVMARHRRAGVGELAARWLFDRYRGRWEVREKAENVRAIAFWRRVIARYTGDAYEELVLDDERWRGPVQRFTV
jgi:predicted acetyltransferase